MEEPNINELEALVSSDEGQITESADSDHEEDTEIDESESDADQDDDESNGEDDSEMEEDPKGRKSDPLLAVTNQRNSLRNKNQTLLSENEQLRAKISEYESGKDKSTSSSEQQEGESLDDYFDRRYTEKQKELEVKQMKAELTNNALNEYKASDYKSDVEDYLKKHPTVDPEDAVVAVLNKKAKHLLVNKMDEGTRNKIKGVKNSVFGNSVAKKSTTQDTIAQLEAQIESM